MSIDTQCGGMTALGVRCKRRATQGEYCKSHEPDDNKASSTKPATKRAAKPVQPQPQQCKATLKNGTRCTRKAQKNSEYCGTTSHQAQGQESKPVQLIAGAPATPLAPSIEYADIAATCMAKFVDCDEQPGVQVQWVRLALDATRSLKQELRDLEAQFVQYYIEYADPLKPVDEAPEMPELPEPS